MSNDTHDAKPMESDTIDFNEIFRKIWRKKYTLLKYALGGFIISLIVVFSIPKEYVSRIKFTHDIGDQPSQAAGLSTILVGPTAQGINSVPFNTDIYPVILTSRPFLKDLLFTHLNETGKLRVYDYIEKDIRHPWWHPILTFPYKVAGLFKSDQKAGDAVEHDIDKYGFNKKQQQVAEALAGRMELISNQKTNVISLSVKMQDPMYALQIVDSIFISLQEYIIDYKTDKAWSDYEFAHQTFEQAKEEYLKAQQRYASFIDKNHNIFQQSAAAEKDFLQNEMYLAYRVYDQASQALSAARIKVQEETPVFVVIEPANLPQRADYPRKTFTVIVFVILSFLLGLFVVVFSDVFKNFFRTIRSDDQTEINTAKEESSDCDASGKRKKADETDIS